MMDKKRRSQILCLMMCLTVMALTIFSAEVSAAVRRYVPQAGYSLVYFQAADAVVPMPNAPAVASSSSAVKDYVPPVDDGPVKGADCSNSSYSSSSVSTYMVPMQMPMQVRSTYRSYSSTVETSSNCSGVEVAPSRAAIRHEAKSQKHAVKAGLLP